LAAASTSSPRRPPLIAVEARRLLVDCGIKTDGESDAYAVARAESKLDALADHPHPFAYCMENIAPKANVSDPEAFCAAMVKKATGMWPAEGAKKGK